MLDARVGCEDPSVFVTPEPGGIVDIHLDQVLVEAVEPTAPAAPGIQECPIVDIHAAPHQARPWLILRRLRVEQILLSLRSKLAVSLVSSEIAQAKPLEDESPSDSKPILPGAFPSRFWVKEEMIVGHSTWSIESDFEMICQGDRLTEQGINTLLVRSHLPVWPL